MRSLALAALSMLAPSAGGSPQAPDEPEPSALVPVLFNGDFSAQASPGLHSFPWWQVHGSPELREREGRRELVLSIRDGRPDRLSQPLPAFGPLVEGFVLRGRMQGAGLLTLSDGLGGLAPWHPQEGELFEVRGSDFSLLLGRSPQPRLALELSVDLILAEGRPQLQAVWSELEAHALLPCPSEASLREEVRAVVSEIFEEVLARGLDRVGDRETAFWCRDFDAVSGEPLGVPFPAPGIDSVAEALLRAWTIEQDPAWTVGLERLLADWFELGFQPETGLPRFWDAVADVPLDKRFVQIHRALRFLLDLVEEGPEAWRERALERARRVGEAVLAGGVLPSEVVAALYRPLDGAASDSVAEIRVLNLPAQLGRLGALLDDERYLAVARDACLSFEYTNYWHGDWRRIDPGFDDTFGNIGWDGVLLWQAWPDEPAFRRLPRSGYEAYAPMFADALRYGGNVASDQVRCWRILRELAVLDPSLASEVRVLLLDAARSHFRGQQSEGGGWRDVTIIGFDPKGNLGVGDTAGLPQNLLQGLALLYDPRLGMCADEAVATQLRAMFTAVLRSTVATYREPHGFRDASRPGGAAGVSSLGSLRMLPGLVEMLRHLTP